MKKSNFLFGGFYLLSALLSNNAYSFNRIYGEDSRIYSYIYNKIPQTTLVATLEGEEFHWFQGHWEFADNKAYYRRNIKLYTIVHDIKKTNDSSSKDEKLRMLYSTNKIKIDIQKKDQSIGYCELTYIYKGGVHLERENPHSGKYEITFNPISIVDRRCTPGYEINTRGTALFPNSLYMASSRLYQDDRFS